MQRNIMSPLTYIDSNGTVSYVPVLSDKGTLVEGKRLLLSSKN